MYKTCCFIGYNANNMYGYRKEDYAVFKDQLVACIKNLYQAGYRTFISGGEQGFDQLVFWAVQMVRLDPACSEGIVNNIYIPFNGQELRWAEDGYFGQAEYRTMLDAADEVKVISEGNSIGALFMRNKAMVDDSDGVICLYEDDLWAAKKDVIVQTMKYASKHAVNMWQIVFDKTKPAPYKIKQIQERAFK